MELTKKLMESWQMTMSEEVDEIVNSWLRQHFEVDRVAQQIPDSDGNASWPYRAVDTIGAMHRRGSITDEQAAAGLEFRDKWDLACLDQLKAADLSRVPGSHGKRDLSHRAYSARKWIWARVDAMGGVGSVGSSIVIHVLGYGETIKDWCGAQALAHRRAFDQRTAAGVLIAMLDVLRGYGTVR